MTINSKLQIEDFAREDDQIWFITSDGSEDYINRKRFEKWLAEDTNYLELNHGRTANNYREICLDVEGFYRSDNVCEVLSEYLEVPKVITQNKYNHFQNISL